MTRLPIHNSLPSLHRAVFLCVGLLLGLSLAIAGPATDVIRADVAVLDDVSRSVVDRVHAARRLLHYPLEAPITDALARNITLRELPTWDDSWDRLGASIAPIQELISFTPEAMTIWAQKALDADEVHFHDWKAAFAGFQGVGCNPIPALQNLATTEVRSAKLARILPELPNVFRERPNMEPAPQAKLEQTRDGIAAHTIENEKTYREENHIAPDAALPFPIPGNTGLQRHSPGTTAIPPPRQEAGTEQITALSHPTPRGPTAEAGSFWSHSWVWLAMASLLGAFALALKQLRKARR